MKEITLRVNDEMAQLVEQLVGHLEGVEMVCSMDSDVSEDDCAQCAKEAFESLLADGAIRRPRDYAWIMMAMNQGAIDDFETFRSHQDFIDYLKEIGLTEALNLNEHEAARWLMRDELNNVKWLPADIKVVEIISLSYCHNGFHNFMLRT